MDIKAIRNDIQNYGSKLFLNSAGSSLMPKSIVPIILEYLRQEEDLGGYFVAEKRKEDINDFYLYAAKLIGAQPHNIAFTHDATDAYVKALSSIPFNSGDIIITTDDDYSSNQIQFISMEQRFGITIKRIQTFENGDLDIDHFKRLVEKQKPKLVAVTHVPTNSGLIQNVEEIGKICRDHGIIYIVDACQSVGQLSINVSDIHCDFLTTTGRKFLRGPRGTGFLYVSDRLLDLGFSPLMIDCGGANWNGLHSFEMLPSARRFQTWEAPYALILGLTEAMRYTMEVGIERIQNYNHTLMDRLRENLSSVHGVKMYDNGTRRASILTFRKDGVPLDKVKKKFEEKQVFFSISPKESGVIDYDKKGIDGAIRLSPHYFNTIAEIDAVSEIIDAI